MKPIIKYSVAPKIPESITKLQELAYNFWWSWNADAKELFATIDDTKWVETNHNPVLLLKRLSQEKIRDIAEDEKFAEKLNAVYERFQLYMRSGKLPDVFLEHKGTIAYFCAEFGLNECFQNYSGGLGVLAGDHMKTASDLSLPLVGVGLLYQQGYFHQYIAQNGWQTERYIEYDYSTLPLELMKDASGIPHVVSIDFPTGTAYAQIWRANVGRIPLYLLDTNIPQNESTPAHRDITDQLYGGTTETRIMQEMMLGIGGMRALEKLGIEAAVIHLNEGHAAFTTLERTKTYMKKYNLDFASAVELTRTSGCFTTHTPVPAGNEVFTTELIKKFFELYYPTLGLSEKEFLDLARHKNATDDDGFSMTILGLRMSSFRNGVSKLHGAIARRMWKSNWEHLPAEETPILGITNGVHTMTWIAKEFVWLFNKYFAADWKENIGDNETWKSVRDIPDEELWQTHELRRGMLVDYVRNHLRRKENQHITSETLERIGECLHPKVLTIGIARRFATYKRSGLLFSNMDRLARIITNPERPVQIVITGKAHPRDNAGKEIMQQIVSKIRQYGLDRRIVFLEDYDMGVAKFLVKGSDIWLNTPRRPYEASGTSGMKAALSGVLHCSVLDGWWAEAYNGENGFAIGRGEDYVSSDEQDMVEAETLYSLIENTIVSMFYERDEYSLPRKWISRMKNCIETTCGEYSTARMLNDYVHEFYVPALRYAHLLSGKKAQATKELVSWRKKIESSWSGLSISSVSMDSMKDIYVGKRMSVHADVDLGALSESDVRVQLYYGTLDSPDNILNPRIIDLHVDSKSKNSRRYKGSYVCEDSGTQGATVRVVPTNSLVANEADLPYCKWAEV